MLRKMGPSDRRRSGECLFPYAKLSVPVKRGSPQPFIGTPTTFANEASSLLCASWFKFMSRPVRMPMLAPAATMMGMLSTVWPNRCHWKITLKTW